MFDGVYQDVLGMCLARTDCDTLLSCVLVLRKLS